MCLNIANDMKIQGSTNTGIIVDIVTFLSAIVLIWVIESVRLVPLHLASFTARLIVNVFSVQLSGSGSGMLVMVALGLLYTALLSAGVVFFFRQIRQIST